MDSNHRRYLVLSITMILVYSRNNRPSRQFSTRLGEVGMDRLPNLSDVVVSGVKG